jgi:hypothetical protein
VGITDAGIIYGSFKPDLSIYGTQGFTANNGVITPLPYTTNTTLTYGAFTSFQGVSSNGQYITGTLPTSSAGNDFYLKTGSGPYVDTGLVGYLNNGLFTAAPDYAPTAVNNDGTVAGSVWTQVGNTEVTSGFLYRSGVVTSFNDPTLASTLFSGINNSGEVVGSGFNQSTNSVDSFSFENGVFTDIVAPSNETFQANSINDSGVIAGNLCSAGSCVGALYANGLFTTPDASLADISYISNSGILLGTGNAAGTFFEATPNVSAAPEPASISLLFFGGSFGLWLLRKRNGCITR